MLNDRMDYRWYIRWQPDIYYTHPKYYLLWTQKAIEKHIKKEYEKEETNVCS